MNVQKYQDEDTREERCVCGEEHNKEQDEPACCFHAGEGQVELRPKLATREEHDLADSHPKSG